MKRFALLLILALAVLLAACNHPTAAPSAQDYGPQLEAIAASSEAAGTAAAEAVRLAEGSGADLGRADGERVRVARRRAGAHKPGTRAGGRPGRWQLPDFSPVDPGEPLVPL